MLVATRDPMPHPETQAPPVAHHEHRVPPSAPRVARVMTALQLTGSLLAIPVALGSAYSVYQANFSPDLACQSLRAGIIAMIDKKIDATTRRMLVRRDVETFEKSCGAFDPDAKAAFAMLLAAEPKSMPVRAVATPKMEAPKAESVKAETPKTEPAKAETVKVEAKSAMGKIEPQVKDVTRKAESRPAIAAKQAPASIETDAANSDARWLDAVRGALVMHGEPPAAVAPAPAARPLGRLVMPAPQGPAVAPALPPATPVAAAPAQNPEADHPVPPAAIPDAPPLDIANAGADQRPAARSSWISHIPFVGRALDR